MRWLVLLLACVPATAAIRVLTNFEGGNIGRVEFVTPTHLRCAVQGQADHDGRNRQANWYYFELTGLPRAEITLDLVNIAGEYDYRAPAYAVDKGTRPVFSYDGREWAHFPDDQVAWEPAEPHLTLHFTPRAGRLWIAHVQPFLNEQAIPQYKGPDLVRETIGRSVENRPIELLTITNPAISDSGKKVIWLMFRQHAWEAGSSWVGKGAIDRLLSADGGFLRDQAIWKILPIADPDGVAHGGVRYNRNGYDLNRNWDIDDPKLMPEIAAQKTAIFDWLDSGHRIDLFLSIHNTETNEYLESPAEFRPLADRILDTLTRRTTFYPAGPLHLTPATAAKGRMTVAQGLYSARKIPAMLMEQRVEYNARLKRCPTVQDRIEFGAQLVQALYDAVR